MKNIGLLLLLTLLLGCRSGEENAVLTPPKIEQPPSTTVMTPEPIKINPFAATYRGYLPCSECQSGDIETILQLTDEKRYFLTIRKTDNEERHFSGQYRISADKRFIQLDDSADTLTFLLGNDYIEPRLPDGSIGKRQFPSKNYQLNKQPLDPEIEPIKEESSIVANA